MYTFNRNWTFFQSLYLSNRKVLNLEVFQKKLVMEIIFNIMYYASFFRVTGGELFEDIVAREFYSEVDAR